MLGWLLGRIMREAETVVGVEHTVPRPARATGIRRFTPVSATCET